MDQVPPASQSWQLQMKEALADFIEVAQIAGATLVLEDLQIEFCPAPHRAPTRLPAGTMALYAFHGCGAWLKVGIAGQQSQARFTSQHYNAGSAPSTLAASLCNDSSISALAEWDPQGAGDWIQNNCHRVNVLVPAHFGRPVLALLEAFLHVRLKPKYER